MPGKTEVKKEAAPVKAVKKRKPLDEMSRAEMVKAGIYQDIIDDRHPE